MTVIAHRNQINAICHLVLRERYRSPPNGVYAGPPDACRLWSDYGAAIGGLPADMRTSGIYLALAYLMDGEMKKGGKGPNLGHAAGFVLADLWRIDLMMGDQGQMLPTRTLRKEVAEWIDTLADLGSDPMTYMRRTEHVLSLVDHQKRVARQMKILACP